jgi:hypothetical protein
MGASLAAAAPVEAAAPVHGTVEWKTSDPKHAQRFGVSVMCFWQGSHVAVRLAFRSRTDRPASIDVTPLPRQGRGLARRFWPRR